MAQQLVLAEEELARKAGATRVLSLGVLATVGAGEIIAIIIRICWIRLNSTS